MRPSLCSSAFMLLVLAACKPKPPCGVQLQGGGEATVTLSNRTPAGPDVTWTVSGLTSADLEDYVPNSGYGLQRYLMTNEMEGYVVSRPRKDDGRDPEFHFRTQVDGVLDDCFSAAYLQFSGETDANGWMLLGLSPMDDFAVDYVDPSDVTMDFEEGRFMANGVPMRGGAAVCLGETDIEVVWELDPEVVLEVPEECGSSINW